MSIDDAVMYLLQYVKEDEMYLKAGCYSNDLKKQVILHTNAILTLIKAYIKEEKENGK